MGTLEPIHQRRIDAEARRLILREASEAAQARLGEFETDDPIVLDVIGLLQMECWRIEHWAAATKFEAECLRSLRYVGHEFPMTEHNLKVLLICLYIVDDRYRDAYLAA